MNLGSKADMHIQLLSDLHFEFHRDGGRSFIESLDPNGVDVLVLAGDIDVATGLFQSLTAICRRFSDSSVMYVPGNHEYYHSSLNEVHHILNLVRNKNRNFVWLNNNVIELGGVCFLGTTLWFPRSDAGVSVKRMLSDFSVIQDFESWVYGENLAAVDFLSQNLRKGDIVVTHHLPSPQCVSSRYADSVLNPFFVCDLTNLILEREPLLWMFGHTHDSVSTSISPSERTLVRCNPFGYAHGGLNPNFRERLIIDV